MQIISNILGRLIGFISTLLVGFGFLMLLKQMNKSNRIRFSSHILSILFSAIMLLFNVFVLKKINIQWWFFLFLIFGAGFGFAWGTTTKLNLNNNVVVGKRSVLYIYFWIASLAITQLLSMFAKTNVVAFGLAGMFFSTGASTGSNLNIISRMRHLIVNGDVQPKGAYCTNCGNELVAGDRFCRQCGSKTGT